MHCDQIHCVIFRKFSRKFSDVSRNLVKIQNNIPAISGHIRLIFNLKVPLDRDININYNKDYMYVKFCAVFYATLSIVKMFGYHLKIYTKCQNFNSVARQFNALKLTREKLYVKAVLL